jgi:uncharacterized membrane protein (DUF373 family)
MGGASGKGETSPRRVLAAIQRLVDFSEFVVVAAAELLLIGAILFATVVVYDLFIGAFPVTITSIASLDDLQAAIEHVFAGVMLLLLGLELLKSLSSFVEGYRVQVQMIIVVAIIAVARHILMIDFDRVEPIKLIGIAALVLTLAISYAIVRERGLARSPVG